jgi:hypothetical protein
VDIGEEEWDGSLTLGESTFAVREGSGKGMLTGRRSGGELQRRFETGDESDHQQHIGMLTLTS